MSKIWRIALPTIALLAAACSDPSGDTATMPASSDPTMPGAMAPGETAATRQVVNPLPIDRPIVDRDPASNGWAVVDETGETMMQYVSDAQRGVVFEMNTTNTARDSARAMIGDAPDQDLNPNAKPWSDIEHDSFSMWIRNMDPERLTYQVILLVETTKGPVLMVYQPNAAENFARRNQRWIYLDPAMNDGAWRHLARNLQDDLHALDPEEELVTVNGIRVLGRHLRLDDIQLEGFREQALRPQFPMAE